MSIQLLHCLEPYTLRARLLPALFTFLPATLAIAAWFPDNLAILGSLLGFVGLFGGLSSASEWIRDRGKRIELRLFEKWGGKPSTILLRHRDTTLNLATKSRYHRRLTHALPDLRLPAAEDELADPTAADSIYSACGDYLREKSRDQPKFSLLLNENIQYGTRRNLLGAKPVALWVAFLSLLSCGAATWLAFQNGVDRSVPISCTAFIFFACLFWLFRVTPVWVRTTAFTYAERLLATCDSLQTQQQPQPANS